MAEGAVSSESRHHLKKKKTSSRDHKPAQDPIETALDELVQATTANRLAATRYQSAFTGAIWALAEKKLGYPSAPARVLVTRFFRSVAPLACAEKFYWLRQDRGLRSDWKPMASSLHGTRVYGDAASIECDMESVKTLMFHHCSCSDCLTKPQVIDAMRKIFNRCRVNSADPDDLKEKDCVRVTAVHEEDLAAIFRSRAEAAKNRGYALCNVLAEATDTSVNEFERHTQAFSNFFGTDTGYACFGHAISDFVGLTSFLLFSARNPESVVPANLKSLVNRILVGHKIDKYMSCRCGGHVAVTLRDIEPRSDHPGGRAN